METFDKSALTKIPAHVAIIMDGNGRWAQKRGLPRKEGHRAGVENMRRVLEAAAGLGKIVVVPTAGEALELLAGGGFQAVVLDAATAGFGPAQWKEIKAAAGKEGRDPAALQIVSRGSFQLHASPQGTERRPLRGTRDEIRDALSSLPQNRTPTARDWERLSTSWRPRLDHQIAMPDVPMPETLPSEADLKKLFLDSAPAVVRRTSLRRGK